MAMSSPPSMDSSSSSYCIKGDRESPKNRSSSFSISAILSDDIGSQKKSNYFLTTTPTSNGARLNNDRVHSETPKRPREVDASRNNPPRRHPQITLTEAGSLIAPSTSTTVQAHPSHPVAMMGGNTPPLHPSRHLNSSLSASPFDPSFLHALGQQASPTEKEDVLSDSLSMLSAVAMYHGELSSTLGTPIQNRMADIRITSSHDGSDKSSDYTASQRPTATKSRTPSILKRRARKSSSTVGSESGTSGDESRHRSNNVPLNMGFLSPLADEKSTQQSGFSPSIFLSRPDTSLHSEPVKTSPSPLSDTDSNQDDDFTTSTPIKRDKENVAQRNASRRQTGWSPNILRGGRRLLLKESNESSSGSESEHPVKRPHPSSHSPPKKKRKKSKARTKLSPLLENACSPILKADHIPSPLTQSRSTTPTRPPQSHAPHSGTSLEVMEASTTTSRPLQIMQNIPHSSLSAVTPGVALPMNERLGNPFLKPSSLSMPLNFSQPQPTCIIPQFPTRNLVYPMNPVFSATSSVLGPTPLQQPILSPTHQYPRSILSPTLTLPQQSNPYLSMPFYLPHTNSFGGSGFVQLQVMPNIPIRNTQSFIAHGNSFVSGVQGNSLNSSHGMSSSSFVTRDEKLKSVPPRFIFSNMRPEGKRSRLTEAINKSLSETPSENTKLPKEWTKYACGQTNDQRDLTEKARSFILQCRPRALNFEEEAS